MIIIIGILLKFNGMCHRVNFKFIFILNNWKFLLRKENPSNNRCYSSSAEKINLFSQKQKQDKLEFET